MHLLIAALTTGVLGQDTLSDDAIFNGDLFDRTVSQAAEVDSQNRLRYLPGISFVSEAAGYHSISSGANGSDGRFYGKAFLKATKADIGSMYLGYAKERFVNVPEGVKIHIGWNSVP